MAGQFLSAIQLTTAAGICAMLDLLREGRLAARGFVRQEDVALEEFLANRFGRYYEGHEHNAETGIEPRVAAARIAA